MGAMPEAYYRRPLLSGLELASACGGVVIRGDPKTTVAGVSTDSRQVVPGDLFFALKGQNQDGHKFLDAAWAAGAAGAVVSDLPPGDVPPGRLVIRVPDTVGALGRLAGYFRERFSPVVVGITGSVGKTTTKDFTAAVLGRAGNVLANHGNLNTEVGLPLTVFRLRPEHAFAVFEMGMRGPGQISALCNIARPQVGVITNIGTTHLELLGSIEAIANAKKELILALPPYGRAVLWADDPWLWRFGHETGLPVVWFGFGEGRAAGAGGVYTRGAIAVHPDGTDFELAYRDFAVPVHLGVPGRHIVLDALAAAAVGFALGLDPETIRAGLERAAVSGMRSEILHTGSFVVINDAYNASPVSMRAALELLGLIGRGRRKVAVLGDMLELGEASREAHREVGRLVYRLGVDVLVAVGPRSRDMVRACHEEGMDPRRVFEFSDAATAAEAVPSLLEPGDAILVKASRGTHLELVVAALQRAAGAGPGGSEP